MGRPPACFEWEQDTGCIGGTDMARCAGGMALPANSPDRVRPVTCISVEVTVSGTFCRFLTQNAPATLGGIQSPVPHLGACRETVCIEICPGWPDLPD